MNQEIIEEIKTLRMNECYIYDEHTPNYFVDNDNVQQTQTHERDLQDSKSSQSPSSQSEYELSPPKISRR